MSFYSRSRAHFGRGVGPYKSTYVSRAYFAILPLSML